jgi:hypothetical protein
MLGSGLAAEDTSGNTLSQINMKMKKILLDLIIAYLDYMSPPDNPYTKLQQLRLAVVLLHDVSLLQPIPRCLDTVPSYRRPCFFSRCPTSNLVLFTRWWHFCIGHTFLGVCCSCICRFNSVFLPKVLLHPATSHSTLLLLLLE